MSFYNSNTLLSVLLFTFSFYGALQAQLVAQPSVISAVVPTCACPVGNEPFVVLNKCFCGDQAKTLADCVYAKNSNWPFVTTNTTDITQGCPDVSTHPQAFKDCLASKVPAKHPNADKDIDECLKSTKVIETSMQMNNTSSSTNSTGSKSGASQSYFSAGTFALLSILFML